MTDEDELKREWRSALDDAQGQAYRRALCHGLGVAFSDVGRVLWEGGQTIGSDRVDGTSPFDFGSDATVGLATVIQVAGELTAGAVALLENDNFYAAAALVRQIVEVEYLAWAFAEDQDEATAWLRSTAAERRKFWQPRQLRARSQGRFRSQDYGSHCDQGGHPTPEANRLLPGHSDQGLLAWWWYDLALHGISAWRYIDAALTNFNWDLMREQPSAEALSRLIAGWNDNDPLPALSTRTRDFLSSRRPPV
jgi:hypothetical protein